MLDAIISSTMNIFCWLVIVRGMRTAHSAASVIVLSKTNASWKRENSTVETTIASKRIISLLYSVCVYWSLSLAIFLRLKHP